jgi:hypothetical protein
VPRGVVVVHDHQVIGEAVRGEIRVIRQEVAHVAVGPVELLGDHEHLEPVARRDDDGLADVIARRQVVEQLRQAVGIDRERLEHR